MPDDDRERPRKSWREIDAQRDRSSQTTPRGREDKPRPGQRSQKSYRAALDRLFETVQDEDLIPLLWALMEILAVTIRTQIVAKPTCTSPSIAD